MSVADPEETDDVGDLTETDFFERARWAATGEPFDAPGDDEARAHALAALRAHLDEGAAQAARGGFVEGFDVEAAIARAGAR